MSGQARIDSVDQLRVFRTQMVKFAEQAMTALADAEGEMQRVLVWLETEANTYWSGQIRKRAEAVEKAKDAVRQKKLFKSPTGSTQSAVEEEKALRMAQKRLEEAENKLKAVRRYTPKLQKEISMYKGGVQRLATNVASDIPTGIGRLDRMVAALEAYAAMQVSGGGGDDSSGELFNRMARALGDMGPDVPNYKPLRDKTIALDRKTAVPGDTRLEQWMAGPLHDLTRELFGKIAAERKPPAPTDTIHIEADAWDSGKIYLERVPDAEDGSSVGDSGWYLARADGETSKDPALTMTVASLLQGRPDLVELLALPAGYLIVMTMTSVETILDERGRDVWSAIKPAS